MEMQFTRTLYDLLLKHVFGIFALAIIFLNVSVYYFAKDALKNFYRELDPTNSFNPGIGKTTKRKNWAEHDGGCCGGHH